MLFIFVFIAVNKHWDEDFDCIIVDVKRTVERQQLCEDQLIVELQEHREHIVKNAEKMSAVMARKNKDLTETITENTRLQECVAVLQNEISDLQKENQEVCKFNEYVLGNIDVPRKKIWPFSQKIMTLTNHLHNINKKQMNMKRQREIAINCWKTTNN